MAFWINACAPANVVGAASVPAFPATPFGATITPAGDDDDCTVTTTDALLLASATLVAFTVCVPAETGATYVTVLPVPVTVPTVPLPPATPSTVQVTAVFDEPLTVAVTEAVPPAFRLIALEGVNATPTPAAACTVTDALALLLASTTLVAVTTSLPALAGAVYRPVLLTVPLCDVQVTAVL